MYRGSSKLSGNERCVTSAAAPESSPKSTSQPISSPNKVIPMNSVPGWWVSTANPLKQQESKNRLGCDKTAVAAVVVDSILDCRQHTLTNDAADEDFASMSSLTNIFNRRSELIEAAQDTNSPVEDFEPLVHVKLDIREPINNRVVVRCSADDINPWGYV